MAKPSISIQIVLSEDLSTVKSFPRSIVRHCGDEILGYLEAVTCGTFEFDIVISFEGLVRTWIGFGSENENGNPHHRPPTSELQASRFSVLLQNDWLIYNKFLKQTLQIFSEPSSRSNLSHWRIQRLPFRFIIPHELISARSNVHSDFLQLCPSAKLGFPFWGHTAQAYRQPAITYVIRIARIRTEIPSLARVRSDVEREIIVMPYTLATPPLQMEYFPRDYRPSTTKPLKQHRWERLLGVLNVSATEPPPLNIWTSAPRASTTATLKLTLSPLYLCELGIQPHQWEYLVTYHLRSRTFYSTHRLDQIPTMVSAKQNPFQEIRVGEIRSEVREIGPVPWKIDCQNRSSEHVVGLHKEDCCMLTANLTIPISAPKTLLPTFLNQLSARQYALALRLSIKGFYHAVIELVLPVQVIFHPPNGMLGISHGESRVESREPILLAISRRSINFINRDFDWQDCLLQTEDSSPPSYD